MSASSFGLRGGASCCFLSVSISHRVLGAAFGCVLLGKESEIKKSGEDLSGKQVGGGVGGGEESVSSACVHHVLAGTCLLRQAAC